jgi:hypothetical protein
MAKTEAEIALSERLRKLLALQLGDRGRFALLERLSGIPIHRWKNFFYGKQSASADMVEFAEAQFPESALWLKTGADAPEQADFPFAAPVPLHLADGGTVAQRLAWVIYEFASPRGEGLFSYLEERSHHQISAKAWETVIMERCAPSLDMILLIADSRPHFFEWICRGRVSYGSQVNPLDKMSVDAYRAAKNPQLGRTGRKKDGAKES